MLTADITVVIPVHTPRISDGNLERAMTSVMRQSMKPRAIVIQHDSEHEGSAVTRNKAIDSVNTEWIAFLDSDDAWYAHHLEELHKCAIATGADVVYPGCVTQGGTDPHDRFGQEFNPDLLRQKSYIPVTSLVRTSLAKLVGGFSRPPGSDYDDWGFYVKLLEAGAIFKHHPVRTWVWHITGFGTPGTPGNTSGLGTRW